MVRHFSIFAKVAKVQSSFYSLPHHFLIATGVAVESVYIYIYIYLASYVATYVPICYVCAFK